MERNKMNILCWSYLSSSLTMALLLPRQSIRQRNILLSENPKHEFRLLAPLNASDMNRDQDDECENEEECEIDWDSMPGFDDDDAAANTENLRNRLEMTWALDEVKEECDVFQPVTCGGSPCRHCRTTGRMPCRFCHGKLYNERLQSICPICDEHGNEVCECCRGSGWVADWTAWGMRPGVISSKLAP